MGWTADAAIFFFSILLVLLIQILRTLVSYPLPRSFVHEHAPDHTPGPEDAAPLAAVDGELAAAGFAPGFWARGRREPVGLPGVDRIRYDLDAGRVTLAQIIPPFGIAAPDLCRVTLWSRLPEGRYLVTSNRAPESLFPEMGFTLAVLGNYRHLAEQLAAHRQALGQALGAEAPVPWPEDPEGSLALFTAHEAAVWAEAHRRGWLIVGADEVRHLHWRAALAYLWRHFTRRWRKGAQPARPVGASADDTGTAAAEIAAARAPTPERACRAARLFAAWEAGQQHPAPLRFQLGLFLVTLGLFWGLGAALWDLTFVSLLLLVVLFHELGHYLAMRACGDRHVQIALLPLVGGVTLGGQRRLSSGQRAFVSLMGPLPGLLVGGLILAWQALDPQPGPQWPRLLAALLVGVNYANLLPIVPFDGGQFLKALLPPRWLLAAAVLDLLAVPGLIALAIFLHSTFIGLLTIVPALAAWGLWRERRLLRQIQTVSLPPATGREGRVAAVFQALWQGQRRPVPLVKEVHTVRRLLDRLDFRAPARWVIVGYLALYVLALGAPAAIYGGDVLAQEARAQWSERLERYRVAHKAEQARLLGVARGLSLQGLVAGLQAVDDAGQRRDAAREAASEATLAAAEARLGWPLPADYRAFLGVSDGLSRADGGAPLLPVTEVAPVATAAPALGSQLTAASQVGTDGQRIVATYAVAGRHPIQKPTLGRAPVAVLASALLIGDEAQGPGAHLYYLLSTEAGEGVPVGTLFAIYTAEEVGVPGTAEVEISRYEGVRDLLLARYLRDGLAAYVRAHPLRPPPRAAARPGGGPAR
jgi:Zn-dependent protease